MAELVLTEKEKQDPLYTDWDDAALGRAVRVVAGKVRDFQGQGLTGVSATGAAFLLVLTARESNAEELAIGLEGHTDGKVETGDWEITVKRLRRPGEPQ